MVRFLALAAVVLTTVGCGTVVHEKDNIIPPSDFTMKDIYDNKGRPSTDITHALSPTILKRSATAREIAISSYDINSLELQPTFKKLPNPKLYIYFPPKLTSDGRLPVPAWMTEFSMYDRDEYALPGELNFGERQ